MFKFTVYLIQSLLTDMQLHLQSTKYAIAFCSSFICLLSVGPPFSIPIFFVYENMYFLIKRKDFVVSMHASIPKITDQEKD